VLGLNARKGVETDQVSASCGSSTRLDGIRFARLSSMLKAGSGGSSAVGATETAS
jgi:hypothetical protein